MISERLEHLAAALRLMLAKDPVIAVDVPVRLRNMSNARWGWQATAKLAKVVRPMASRLVSRAKPECLAGPGLVPLVVRLVYIGPRALDDDGVASAVKSLRDGVADALGVDDRDPRVVWVPDQERGGVREYGARVEVYLG